MQQLTPLLALPWLARILGPDAFGLLMYMCLMPPLVAQIMDWGLNLSGAREASWQRGENAAISKLLGAVISAKFLLGMFCIFLAACLFPILPYTKDNCLAYIFAIMAGLIRGLNPVWLFQGLGKDLPKLAKWDTGASLAILVSTFIFIDSSSKWALYLFFLAFFKACAYGYLTFQLCKNYRPVYNLRDGLKKICDTFLFFGYSFSLTLCYSGTQLIMGFWLPAQAMGILTTGSKILRSLGSAIIPFTQTIYPEICILARQKNDNINELMRLSLGITFLAAILLTTIVWLGTPMLIHIALGTEYANAVLPIRNMLLALPFLTCNNVLAIQILASNEQDKIQFMVTMSIAIVSLPLAALAANCAGIVGGSFLPLILELSLTLGYLGAIRKYCPHTLF